MIFGRFLSRGSTTEELNRGLDMAVIEYNNQWRNRDIWRDC